MKTKGSVKVNGTARGGGERPIYEIAAEIRKNWARVYFGAVPYLEAMESLGTMEDSYGCDSARGIVTYFLANASGWRGDVARRVKAELNARLSGGGR